MEFVSQQRSGRRKEHKAIGQQNYSVRGAQRQQQHHTAAVLIREG